MILDRARQEVHHVYLTVLMLTLLSIGYLALAGSTVDLATIQYDEFTDLVIATRLSEHPLSGHSYDGSQARFPMYVTAVANRVLQIGNPNIEMLDLLPVSRWASLAMTVLAIWGTFLLARRLFDLTTAVLAATLFAFSPYVLHFGGAALTQGDAFTAAPLVFALIAFYQFNRNSTTFWLTCFAFCLALAIAAKFYLAILIPALITYQVILVVSKRYRKPDPFAEFTDKVRLTIDWPYTFLAVSASVLTLLAFAVSLLRMEQSAEISQLFTQVARVLWGGALLGILLCCWLALQDLRARRSNPVSPAVYWKLSGAWLAILPLAMAVALALFPTHIFNPYVLPTLFERFITMDGSSSLLGETLNSARLYLGLLLFKLGLPLGVTILVALLWAGVRSVRDKRFLLITVVLFYYGLMLAVLPLQQPFWLISIYPLILIALSALIIRGLNTFTDPRIRFVWAGYMAVALAWLAIGLLQVYPTFGLYGYETIGDQWLGHNSRGYREVVVITNDGSTDAIDWLKENAPPETVVVSYLNDVHIMSYLEETAGFPFELRQALRYADETELAAELARANFVVVRAIDDTERSSPVSDHSFIQQFGAKPIYQVFRGRGVYRMPVIQIYQRISDSSVLE